MDLCETKHMSHRENAIAMKNCQQAINAVKSIERRGKTAREEAGASPGAMVSLKVDCRTHSHAQGLVGIVYDGKEETGGV
jgi:hypothetical protein